MYSREAFLVHLYLILKISNYVEFASLLEIYTFLTYKKSCPSKGTAPECCILPTLDIAETRLSKLDEVRHLGQHLSL